MNTVQLPPRHVAEAPPTRRALSATARVGALTGALALASLPAALFHDAIGRAAALHDLAASAHPYFVPAHAALLYGAVPAVVLSAGVLLLAPGILLALAAGAAARIERWLLAALAISLVVVSGAAGLVQGILGRPLEGAAFVGVVAACGALAALVADRKSVV